MADPLARPAARLGWTSGQLWTVAVSLVAALALLLALLPSALHPRQVAAVGSTGVAGLTTGGLAPAASPPAAQPAAAPDATATALIPSTSGDHVANLPVAVPGRMPLDEGGLPAQRPGTSMPTVPTGVPSSAAPRPAPGRSTAPPAANPAALSASLTVTDFGWTAAAGAAGAPASLNDSASDLPVGAVNGRESAHGFLRLTGAGRVLHLTSATAVNDPSGGTLAGLEPGAALVLCPNTTAAWNPGPAQPAGPPYDVSRCVTGQESTDRSDVAFDLRDFTAVVRDSDAGFTVVGDPTQPGQTFSVVFAVPGAA